MKNRVKEVKKKSKINSRRTSRVNWNISSSNKRYRKRKI